MRKRLNVDLDDNPFIYIKICSIFAWLLLAFILVGILQVSILGIWGVITNSKTSLENSDPIYSLTFAIYAFSLWFALVIYQFRRVGIDWNYLIGKVPPNYNWLPVLFITLIRFLFSVGIWRLSYYPISFVFPDWFQSLLIDTDSIKAQNSFSPTIYYCLDYLLTFAISPLISIFIFPIIFLYSFTAKYGKNKAILIICLIGCLLGYNNVIGIFSFTVMILVLYFKSLTLIVPLVFIVLTNFLYLIWNWFLTFFLGNDNPNLIENFQAQLPLGIVLVAISAPYLIYWLYKNRIKESDELPYFVNKSES